MITFESMNESLDFTHKFKIPQMAQEYMLFIWNMLGLSHGKTYFLCSYLQHYLGSWIIYPIVKLITPLQKHVMKKSCTSILTTLDKGERKKFHYWMSPTSQKLLIYIHWYLDAKEEIGYKLGERKRYIFLSKVIMATQVCATDLRHMYVMDEDRIHLWKF